MMMMMMILKGPPLPSKRSCVLPPEVAKAFPDAWDLRARTFCLSASLSFFFQTFWTCSRCSAANLAPGGISQEPQIASCLILQHVALCVQQSVFNVVFNVPFKVQDCVKFRWSLGNSSLHATLFRTSWNLPAYPEPFPILPGTFPGAGWTAFKTFYLIQHVNLIRRMNRNLPRSSH